LLSLIGSALGLFSSAIPKVMDMWQDKNDKAHELSLLKAQAEITLDQTAIAVPTSNVKLNRYGNLAGGQGRIKRLLAKKNTFQGTIGGVAGVWQRPKRGKRSRGGSGTIGQSGLKLLVAYESSTQYQPRFDFYGIAQRSVRTNIGKEMDKAIGRALQSAK